jgi:transcriptional regulator with GAF, ATPase, and Fis domain
MGRRTPLPAKGHALGEQEAERLDHVEARHIEAILKKAGGRVSGKGGAAELLGIHPETLRHRMRKLGIRFGRVHLRQ